MPESDAVDDDAASDVVVTDTALSKAFRYLGREEIENVLTHESVEVYYDSGRETWLVRTPHHTSGTKQPRPRGDTVVLIVDLDGDTRVVITQTKDHYDWSEYTEVDAVGEVPGDG